MQYLEERGIGQPTLAGPVPIVPANYVLQAIPVPEGSHLVQISFFPDSLKWGIILTAVGLLAWVLLMIWAKRLIRSS